MVLVLESVQYCTLLGSLLIKERLQVPSVRTVSIWAVLHDYLECFRRWLILCEKG